MITTPQNMGYCNPLPSQLAELIWLSPSPFLILLLFPTAMDGSHGENSSRRRAAQQTLVGSIARFPDPTSSRNNPIKSNLGSLHIR
jgi:hypothetical protein